MSIVYKEREIAIITKNQPRSIKAQVASNGLAYHPGIDFPTLYTITHVSSGFSLDTHVLFHTPQQCERYISLIDCLARWTKSKAQLEAQHYAQLLGLRTDLAVAAHAVLNEEELLLPYTLTWKVRGLRMRSQPFLVTSEEEAITRFNAKHQELVSAQEIQPAVFIRLFAPNREIPMREHRFAGVAVPGKETSGGMEEKPLCP